jgi:hypothetical protein
MRITSAKGSVTRKAWVSKAMLRTRMWARDQRSRMLETRFDLRTYIGEVTEVAVAEASE